MHEIWVGLRLEVRVHDYGSQARRCRGLIRTVCTHALVFIRRPANERMEKTYEVEHEWEWGAGLPSLGQPNARVERAQRQIHAAELRGRQR